MNAEIIAARFRFAVNVLPKDGISTRRAAPWSRASRTLGCAGIGEVRVGRRVELGRRRPGRRRRARDRRRARPGASVQPADRAVRDRAARRHLGGTCRGGRVSVRVGVVVFPGSNCDTDTAWALAPGRRRARAAVARERRPPGRGRDRPARRLRVRRLPPGRRHRPLQPGDAGGGRLRRGRRSRARHLQRLPGPGRGRPAPGRAAAQPIAPLRLSRRGHPRGAGGHRLHPPGAGRGRAPDAGCPWRGLLLRRRRDARCAGARRPDPLPLRGRCREPGTGRGPGEPERLAPGDRRRDQCRRKRGRPYAAPRTCGGRAARLGRRDARSSDRSSSRRATARARSGTRWPDERGSGGPGPRPGRDPRDPRAAPPRAGADRRGARRDRTTARPWSQRPRARDVQRDVERALLLQEQQAPPADAADRRRRRGRRPGRERRRHADRRRLGSGLQDRVAQPPVRGRAIPGRGHRGRRHPARRLRDGRATDRGPRRAPLRRPGRRPDTPPRQRGRQGGRRLRQLRWRPDGGRRAGLRPVLPGQPARERHGDRAHARGRDRARGRARSREPRDPVRVGDRARRHRRRVGPRLGDVRRPGSLEAAGGPGRRPVRGEAAHRGDPGDPRGGPRRRPLRPRCGRDHLRRLGDRGSRADRHPGGPGRDPAPGAGHGAVRGHDQRVAGTDGGHRAAGTAARDRGDLRTVGDPVRGDRPGHRRRRYRGGRRRPRGERDAEPGRPRAGADPGACACVRGDRVRPARRAASPRAEGAGARNHGDGRRHAAGGRHGPGRGPARAARQPEPCLAGVGRGAVRPARGDEHGRWGRPRGGRPPRQGHAPRARGDHRRERGGQRARPVPGRRALRCRGGP